MPFKTTNDANTVHGQMNTPVTKVSQPTGTEELHDQVQSLPKSQVEGQFYQLDEDEILLDESIIAKPIFINEAYKIKPKDAHYAFRWVEYQAKGGLRYQQMKALGFQNACEDDLLPQSSGGHQAQVDGGKLMLGDTILMKIPKHIYLAHLKANMLQSSAMLKPQSIHEEAKRRMGSIVTGSHGMPKMEVHKGEVFIPNQADVRDVVVTPSRIEQQVFQELSNRE